MANINQILRNLRRKGIENENDLVCPNCGWTIDTDYLYRAISDGNYNLYWEHKITKKNTCLAVIPYKGNNLEYTCVA